MMITREKVYNKLYPIFEELVDSTCDIIEKIGKDNEWISVKDRLPDTHDDVLVTYRSKYNHNDSDIAITSYQEVCFGGHGLGHKDWVSPFEYFKKYYEVIAWKPKPDVYDGD